MMSPKLGSLTFFAGALAFSPFLSSVHAKGEVLKLLGIWQGASFADENQQAGFGEPGKGAPRGDQTTCFAAYA